MPRRRKAEPTPEVDVVQEPTEDVPVEKKRPKRGAKATTVVETEEQIEDLEEKPKRKTTKKTEEEKLERKTTKKTEEEKPERKTTKKIEEEKPERKTTKKTEEEKPKRKTTKKAEPKAAPLNNALTKWDTLDFGCKKKNTKGESYKLKITSWNVDGIRAWVKKEGLSILNYDKPDIFCLQETKCSEDKLPEEVSNIEGYHDYWCSSKKEGYAGVAVYSKTEPIKVTYGIGEDKHDEEGRCITLEYDSFFLVNVYVPNAGRGLVTLPKRLEWNDSFSKYINDLDKNKPVIICGDMNVAHNEIDLANPKSNKKNAGFTPEERQGMTDFLEEGYVDSFRELYPEAKDRYTFWSYMSKARSKNVGWRLDYFILSERIMEKVCDNAIRSEVYGSDHCPVSLFVNI